MGYTHYWTHRRAFTDAQWNAILTDVNAIVAVARADGLALGSADGETSIAAIYAYCTNKESGPLFSLNGVGEDSHETFMVWQKRKPLEEWEKPSQRGWDFCKTARKPYDDVVTAILCYLESVYPQHFSAGSDGEEEDWEMGLALAKRALPPKGNILAVPQEVLT